MIDPFDSPKRSYLRARHHLGDLGEKYNAFVEHQPWTHVIEPDADGITYTHKIKFSKRVAAEMPSIAFDCTQNLRAALDQMAYGIAVLHTKRFDPKHCKFPFCKTETGLGNHIKGACRDLPPEIQSLFAGFKPYKGGNNALWAMNELANSKHFSLVPVQIGNVSLKFQIIKNFFIPPDHIGPWYDPFKNEIILLKTSEPGAQPQYNGKATFMVAFDHIDEVIRGQHPVAFLDTASREVKRVLLTTEAECRRIGIIK